MGRQHRHSLSLSATEESPLHLLPFTNVTWKGQEPVPSDISFPFSSCWASSTPGSVTRPLSSDILQMPHPILEAPGHTRGLPGTFPASSTPSLPFCPPFKHPSALLNLCSLLGGSALGLLCSRLPLGVGEGFSGSTERWQGSAWVLGLIQALMLNRR